MSRKHGLLFVGRQASNAYTVGMRLIFPESERRWYRRLWHWVKLKLRIGGYVTIVSVDYERGSVTVR